ncbi:MAG: hypothetical protein WBD45_10420 [Terriglobales bacterium]
MDFFPRRSSLLYRNRLFAVTLAAAIGLTSSSLLAQAPLTQYGRKAAVDKGPRALGLVQLSPKGKARIIPIAVMMDGKFYDAGSYKAAPVPMALDFGIVYEGFRTGVSQGLFTITQPGQLNHTWIAEGKWLPAGSIDPSKHKKYQEPVIADDDRNGPPVLHRRTPPEADSGSESKTPDKDKDKDKDKSSDASKDQPKTTPAASSAAPATPAPSTSTAPAPAQTAKASPPEQPKATAPAPAPNASSSNDDEPISDPNRPRLRRGKPETTQHEEPFATFAPEAATGASPATPPSAGKSDAAPSSAPAPPIILIPAISDAGGPDPRSYSYDLKPVEEAIYRNKMLDLAATQLLGSAGTKPPAPKNVAANRSAKKSSAKLPSPTFDDVSLRIFDLSSSNEPVLVLSAKAQLPATGSTENPAEPKEITLIARTNLEGELRKLFFEQTDSRHLDISPRMELIDAVDADGDGRGELLFRRTFDDGSAYAIYRVTADRLWPLYEGTP